MVEPVDSLDVIGAHVPGSKDLVWVGLSEESRLAIFAEGVPFLGHLMLVFSFVFTCDGQD